MFKVIWTERAKKDLGSLEKDLAKRIFLKIEWLGSADFLFLEKVKGKEFFKYRVGKYRVFIDKLTEKQILFILAVRHRKKAYKSLGSIKQNK